MQGSSKASLFKLQQIMQKELNTMPKTPDKQKPIDLRHTIRCQSASYIKTALRKIQSLKSFNLDSGRKRECSLTSTRIAEISQTTAFRSRGSADRLGKGNKGNEIKPMKMSNKTKLKKKLSKQDSPKPFQKIKLRQTIEGYPQSTTSGNRQRRQFTLKSPQNVQKSYLSPQEYEAIIEKQKLLIEKLQNIIEQLQDI